MDCDGIDGMVRATLMDILIRPERADDHAANHDITHRAFAPMPFADGDEQVLIGKLRDGGALALSLVAERDSAVIGQVTFRRTVRRDGTPARSP